MSMRVEKSTAEQVRQRLEEAKKRKEGVGSSAADFAPDGADGGGGKLAFYAGMPRSMHRRRCGFGL